MTNEKVIDAHHHFWRYDAEEYGWIGPNMTQLRRNFLPADLKREIDAAGVSGVVSVQARQTIGESDWLLSMAEAHPWILGVVGWAPLVSPAVNADLERLAHHRKLKGVRHVLHDEKDDHYMLRKDFLAGVAHLEKLRLTYDILIFERHLPQTIEFVDKFPNQIFVVDHIAKPRIKDGILEPWRKNIFELARRKNVFCKMSGIVTEANWDTWKYETLRPYLETVLEAFGPQRLMFGSDWPVLLVAGNYHGWLQTVKHVIEPLSAAERLRILSGTATEAYRL